MRIVYGVHGYGRGHATRALAVVQSLSARHDVRLFAGGDAYETLREYFPVQRIPCLELAYHRGRRSNWLTLKNNLPALLDVLQTGPRLEEVLSEMRSFQAEAVICDAEPWTSAAGARLGIPRVGFDHFGILVHCRVALPLGDWFRSIGDRLLYRWLMRWPQHALVSSFFRAAPKKAGVEVVGPLLGEEVKRVQATDGEHLLAYFNQGSVQVSKGMLDALGSIGREVRLYGVGRAGSLGNITFRAPAREDFLRDLASCQAVLSTAGNQLIGEAMEYAKPVLAIPESTVEQRLNAREIVRMGVGESLRASQLTARAVCDFLGRADRYALRARELRSDGRAQAVEWLERWLGELCKDRYASRVRAVQPA